jgi:hypothetical protein
LLPASNLIENTQREDETRFVILPVCTTFSVRRRPHFKTRKSLGKNKNMVMGSDGARNQDLL